MSHSTRCFGHELRSQSLDLCKTPVFPTNYLGPSTSKPNQTATKLQHRNLNNS